jgi:hypothetical protein
MAMPVMTLPTLRGASSCVLTSMECFVGLILKVVTMVSLRTVAI